MAQLKNKMRHSAAFLKGMHNHAGFLSDETLAHLVQRDDMRPVFESLITERLRSFRDRYRDFAERSERYLRKNEKKRYQDLLVAWTADVLSYLGYQNFNPQKIDHPEGGYIPYLAADEDSHSVAIFFCVQSEAPLTADQGALLSTEKGDVLHESKLKPSLTEQVERAIKLCGRPEALLILPHALYYFRADSQLSGQCLEVRWDELAAGDHDQALAVASYILRADFFAFSGSSDDESAASSEDEEAESDEEEAEEEASGSGGTVRMTASATLFKEDLQQSRAITEELHKQVVLALEILINERLAVDKDLQKLAKHERHNQRIAEDLFKDGLFVLYRALFVLYAEARDFLPVDHEQFGSFYSLDHLRNWSENFLRKQPRGLANSEGTYIWGAMQSTFTLLRRGVTLADGRLVSPYNGQLFAPDKAPYFDGGPLLRDGAMAKVLTALSRVGGEQSGRRLHFGNLGITQLGAVYESLLAQKPVIIREPSVWVPAHGGGVGLVTQAFSEALGMKTFAQGEASKKATQKKSKSQASSGQDLARFIDRDRPGFEPSSGKFVVAPLGGQKRQTASFYTPPKLAEFLVQRTLKPLVEGKSSQDILKLKIVEPAMGSGGFLIAIVRYLADHLLKAKQRERSLDLRHDNEKVHRDALQRCKREVIESCIYGVDINPLAIELARTSLYLEALLPGEPLPFLHHRLRSGNSLIGADLMNNRTTNTSWEEGFEFPILFDLPIDHIKVDKKIKKAWDEAFGNKVSGEELDAAWKLRLRDLKAERRKIHPGEWRQWAMGQQEKVLFFLQKARAAQKDFDQVQSDNEIIEQLDSRHKDHKALIPDMDPVLIEAYGVTVDDILMKKRKKALLTELGDRRYHKLVEGQRSLLRLRALGDIHCAFWYWPLDASGSFPGFKVLQELYNWLLDENTLNPKSKAKPFSKAAVQTLKTALRVAREKRFFHWDLEFAAVFAEATRLGFDACISNPPWKVVGVKDKEVYPAFDPQYLDTKPSDKKERLKKLNKNQPEAALAWYEQSLATSRMTEHWRQGRLSEIPPEGKVDLAALFVLRSERLVRQKGRMGLLVSRSSLFVNKASKNIRERFFADWGLEESCSFINRLSLFEIASYLEFSLLVGRAGGASKTPRFIHALVDPNTLDVVSRNIELKDVSKVGSGPRPIELNLSMIKSYFSKDNLSIPGITDPRQLEIAEALHRASGPVTYLDQLEGVVVQQGINQTAGPKKGFSQYTDKIPAHELPKWEDVLNGKLGKWVPLYRGRDFDLFEPQTFQEPNFIRFSKPEVLLDLGIDIGQPSILWRSISQVQNQRTLISCMIPKGIWCDHSAFCLQISDPDLRDLTWLTLSSISTDFLARLTGSTNQTFGLVSSLPIARYGSLALTEAKRIAKSNHESRKKKILIDALIFIHIGQNIKPLDRNGFEWIVKENFECLNRNDRNYATELLQAFDWYTTNNSKIGKTPNELFMEINRKVKE